MSVPIELSLAPPVITRERYVQLAGRVKLLSWLSLAWILLIQPSSSSTTALGSAATRSY